MKIFLAVCENGYNVTKAADALFMTQPAVSLALKELEGYYGVLLFERMSRQLFITEAGKQMREYATHILSLFDHMEKGLRDWDSLGILRVGASVTIGSQFMPSYISAYSILHPGMDVRVCISSSELLEEKLQSNKLDFAFIEGAVQTPNLISEEYMEDSLTAICSVNGPFSYGERVSVEQFKQQRFLLRERGSGTREEFDSATQAAGFSVVPVWEATSTTALVNAVIHGLGIAVLPRRMILGPLNHGLILAFDVDGINFQRKFSILYHKNKFLTQSAREFIELCKNYELDYPIPKYNGLY
ncbi:LysR family transcriptional regulator [Lacrimispora saccharolytica]|nr:LysR family transcriptional regulator [Lacrimispora saccharolytica]